MLLGVGERDMVEEGAPEYISMVQGVWVCQMTHERLVTRRL